jgi:hypothetical protein
MVLLWILFAMPVLSLCYTVYVIARNGGVRMPACVIPLSPITYRSTGRLGVYPQEKREVRWIFTKEFEALLRESEDVIVIVIDLRPQTRKERVPFTVGHVLSISPGELLDILRWLPTTSSVVLYGTPDLCASLLWTARNISGSAPLYVLAEVPMRIRRSLECSTQ